MNTQKFILSLVVLYLPIICMASEVEDCTKLFPPISGLLKNGTAVSVTHENKTRVYTTKGFFEFRTDSNTCTLFDSRKTIYDLYAEAFKSQLDKWAVEKRLENVAIVGLPSKPDLESLQRELDMSRLIKTCREVDSAPFRKKILDILEKGDYPHTDGKKSPNPNKIDSKTSS